MAQTALITGVAGQDGVLLARHLRAKGYHVVGTDRPGRAVPRTYLPDILIQEHDLTDAPGFRRLLDEHRPDEIYNLAGFTSVGASWDHPRLVSEVNDVAVEHMLATVMTARDSRGATPKFFQASSCEMFGRAVQDPQDELTPHDPQNPYAEAKSRAHRRTVEYRQRHGLFACTGILYNHESPLRGPGFVTRKIVRAAAEISLGRRTGLGLGNLDVHRDWGAAHEYVRAMHAAMVQSTADDYVIATGRLHSLAELLETAFSAAGVADPWSHVTQDPALMRKADHPGLRGDPSHARERLGWSAQTSFEDLVTHMVNVDIARVVSGVEESVRYLDPGFRAH